MPANIILFLLNYVVYSYRPSQIYGKNYRLENTVSSWTLSLGTCMAHHNRWRICI